MTELKRDPSKIATYGKGMKLLPQVIGHIIIILRTDRTEIHISDIGLPNDRLEAVRMCRFVAEQLIENANFLEKEPIK